MPSNDKTILSYGKDPARAWFKRRITWLAIVAIAVVLAAIWSLREPAWDRLRIMGLQQQCEDLHRGGGEIICEEDPASVDPLLRTGEYLEVIAYDKRRIIWNTSIWLKLHETIDPSNSLRLSMSKPWICSQLRRPDGTKRLVALYFAGEATSAAHERRQFAVMVIKPATVFSGARILVPQKLLSPVLETPLGPLRVRLSDLGDKSPSSIELKWEVGDQSGLWRFTLTNGDEIELEPIDR